MLMPYLLIQSEIKNVKREDESKPTLSKDIYGTLDDELDGEYHFVANKQTETKIFVCMSCDKSNNSSGQVLMHTFYVQLLLKLSYEIGIFSLFLSF